MNLLIATDKFKGSLSAPAACEAIAKGIVQALPHARIVLAPLADGGEGTLALANNWLKGRKITLQASDPLGRLTTASYHYNQDTQTALIEMAQASGLMLLPPEERNCLHTSTYGSGELIADALSRGARKVYLAIGGSATCDMACGMAAALGYRFLDHEGTVLPPFGESLLKMARIDKQQVMPGIAPCQFEVLCDVNNPLYGPEGAALVFGPQKGASKEECLLLDDCLRHVATIAQRDLGGEMAQLPGAGAAGGMGAGCAWFLGAQLVPGIDTLLSMMNFAGLCDTADLIITGEGKVDAQSLSGKVLSGAINAAIQAQKPLIAFCGSYDLQPAALQELIAIKTADISLDYAQKNAARLLSEAAYTWASKQA